MARKSSGSAPHHLSILGGLSRDSSEDGATIGVDYEYRLNRRLGLGAVVEHAFEDIEATNLLAVVDDHLWRGLALQAGPGVAFQARLSPSRTPRAAP